MDWSQFADFAHTEFDHGGPEQSEAFMWKLQTARKICRRLCLEAGVTEIKFVITSGSRSIERNRQVGGKPDSTHLYGRACDIRALTSREKLFIVKSLLLAGFTRIGINDDFIHVDDGEELEELNKSSHVLWLY